MLGAILNGIQYGSWPAFPLSLQRSTRRLALESTSVGVVLIIFFDDEACIGIFLMET